MARNKYNKRVISYEPDSNSFGPLDYDSSLINSEVVLKLDELEAIRLIDYLALNQEEAAKKMMVARTTVQAIYSRARKKIAEALICGKRLKIESNIDDFSDNILKREEKEGFKMRIAVTYENGNIFQHFGHTEAFKLYDIDGGKVVASTIVPTNGQGHGALAGFLVENKADALICGGIGGGAQKALAFRNIKIYGGVKGSCDEAVEALLKGTLEYSSEANCDHHDHEHGEGHECHGSCGEHDHSCGCH